MGYSKYNKAYMDNMNDKCQDIVNKFFKTCTDYNFDQYTYFLKPNNSGFFRYKDLHKSPKGNINQGKLESRKLGANVVKKPKKPPKKKTKNSPKKKKKKKKKKS